MSSKPTPAVFNLISEPWLPVRRRSGAVEYMAPWQVNDRIDEDPFTGFAWPRPDFDGAAHEFLIGLLSTGAAPRDDDDWEDWWLAPPSPETLRQRFGQLAHAFGLDGPGPRFLQDLDPLDDVEERETSALLIDAPGAQTLRNNADLFVKRSGTSVLCRPAAAMALFALSAYAPSGGVGHRTSLRGGGPMTTLVLARHEDYGDTLWGRLWPNVETEEQIGRRSPEAEVSDDPKSIFPWLAPTRVSDRKAGGGPTTPVDVHPLQVYWGMPRRIRLRFEDSQNRSCSLTGLEDSIIVSSYRTRNYGTDYSEGFEHPLTPYYRQRDETTKLPVHPRPGGISYRHWPGLVVQSDDRLRDPAQVVRHWHERAPRGHTRFIAFGYDMDNMKARAWSESEMPLWLLGDGTSGDLLGPFTNLATTGAAGVARLVTGAIKRVLYDPASGNQPSRQRRAVIASARNSIEERFFRETERDFYAELEKAVRMIEKNPDADDPTLEVRRAWAPVLAEAALRLFDEYAPAEGLEDRNMQRHVKARFSLTSALSGRGKEGRSLFEGDLGIPSPDTARSRES